VHVRNSSLITVATPAVQAHKFPGHVTIHGRLAAFLSMEYEKGKAVHKVRIPNYNVPEILLHWSILRRLLLTLYCVIYRHGRMYGRASRILKSACRSFGLRRRGSVCLWLQRVPSTFPLIRRSQKSMMKC
jgi:hypothetical protein